MFQTESGAHRSVSLCDGVWLDPGVGFGVTSEDARRGRKGVAEACGLFLAPLSVRLQKVCALLVECDAALLVGLGVFLPSTGAVLGDARDDGQGAALVVEAVPAERADFAAAGAGGHGDPHEHSPGQALERFVEDAGGLLGGRTWLASG